MSLKTTTQSMLDDVHYFDIDLSSLSVFPELYQLVVDYAAEKDRETIIASLAYVEAVYCQYLIEKAAKGGTNEQA
ncbi:hypothetical protein HPC38_06790 [Pasteurellaceae bacterium HPA106]|uniref:hypothetical protein n=1 Tax=Spirabiliibacterium pneumoniae TaxID=221400 RepID=UPI001AAD6973|nr:hypothetical protein [Spirabiliibacterium pneumoniae]MBE2896580.1 hypothetical protein [Spirabiliibacterium pneumoniae]